MCVKINHREEGERNEYKNRNPKHEEDETNGRNKQRHTI